MSFEANQGQADAQVKFLARGQGYTLFLTPGEAVLGLRSPGAGQPTEWLRLVLHGANPFSALHGESPLPGYSNYFKGNNPARWRTNIPTFARVRYESVYRGVDLVYYGREGKLENDFEIAPGFSPKVISWHLEGADRISVDPSGALVIDSGGKEVRLQRPRAYQGRGDGQREVSAHYRVQGRRVSFALENYNHHETLVIDPVLTYSTYLGGTGGDAAVGVAVDSEDNAYVTGVTASTNFPLTSGAHQDTYAGDGDVFITKFNPTGNALLYSSYLGGSGIDTPSQIMLDATDDIYIVGTTTSNNFPTTSGVFQTAFGGQQNAFLTELNAAGSSLILSTYIGGSGIDFGLAMALDTSGNAYVTGSTTSTNFPTLNPFQVANDGLGDAYVTEISPTGALLYSTYLGGSSQDIGNAIAVDTSGNVYVGGTTYSTNFPTQDPLQSSLAGGADLFIIKFTPGSTALLFSTYLGGSSSDLLASMQLDANNNIYLAGTTQSSNFPTTASAYQSSLAGTSNIFVTKLAASGSAIIFSTYFGGTAVDQANGMTLDAAGNIYVTGSTQSQTFPLLDPFQAILGFYGASNCESTNLVNLPLELCADAFVVKFAATGTPVFSSFLGGSGTDSGQGIAVDSTGSVYVAGSTLSSNFPATYGAFQWNFLGNSVNSNAFLTKISPQDGSAVVLNPQQLNFGTEPLQALSTAETVNIGNLGNSALTINSITTSGDFQQTNNCGVSLPGGGGTCAVQLTFTPSQTGLRSEQLTINDSAGTQAIALTGNGTLTGGSLLFTPTKLTFPEEIVGTSSGSQPAVLVNNGNQPVTITNIAATANFNETNNCGTNFPTVPASLNVGGTCTVVVNFAPTTAGNLTGSVNVTSNAVSGTSSVSLAGTGIPVFSLSANQRSTILVIGTSSTTFTISATAPSSFTNTIALSCGNGATCIFSPASIPAGGSSVATVTSLNATTANPLNFTITGTSAGQTSTISVSIFFADYSLAGTPSGNTVTAGSNATWSITATPINQFSQPVLLSCSNIPPGTICAFSPQILTMTGTLATSTSTFTLETEAQSVKVPPRMRPTLPPGGGRWFLLFGLLATLGAVMAAFTRTVPGRTRIGLALVAATLALMTLAVGCENYVNPINITPHVNGTPSGTYRITITGTFPFGPGVNVTRTTTVNLSVLPSA